MRLLIFIISFSTVYAIIPHDITNQDYNLNQVSKFVKSYENNQLTSQDIYTIWYFANTYQLHPITIMSFQEKETSLITNPPCLGRYNWRKFRNCGYGLLDQKWTKGLKFYLHGGYNIQVYCCAKAIRKSLNMWQKKGYSKIKKTINNGKKTIEIDNAIDYMLYRYTPHDHGTTDFYKIFKKFSKTWVEICQ